MATNYPTGLDTFATIGTSDEMDDEVGTRTHREMHNDANDAIEAIQGELGLSPSGASDTVTARLDALDTTVSGKAAKSANLSDLANAALARANLGVTRTYISGAGGINDYTDITSPVQGDVFIYLNSGDIFVRGASSWTYAGSTRFGQGAATFDMTSGVVPYLTIPNEINYVTATAADAAYQGNIVVRNVAAIVRALETAGIAVVND